MQKALYPEGERVCQAIVLHPPSGIAGGDQLHIAASVAQGAHALLTTPGAGKWYRCGGAEPRRRVDLVARRGRYGGMAAAGNHRLRRRAGAHGDPVALAADSRFIGWEMLCLGRAAAGERFANGRFDLFYRV